jgi:hypothetical protein
MRLRRKEAKMIAINSVVGITAVLAVSALIGVVGIAIHVKKVLNRCKLFVDFAFFMAEREDKKRTLRQFDGEYTSDEEPAV